MADYIFDDWKTMLGNFQDCVQKDLEEIHKQKAEIQQMKAELHKEMEGFKYYRDENCLILSAPKVIIGNVDESGDLLGCTGEVIIKGQGVELNGVGETGHIVNRAPSIRQIAVDPGSDGVENIVYDTSEIVSQACNIVLESDDATDAFSMHPASAGKGGIRIHADNEMQIEAAVSSEKRKTQIENSVAALTTQIADLEKQKATQKQAVDGAFATMQALLDKEYELDSDDAMEGRVNTLDILDIHDQVESALPMLCRTAMTYVNTISQLAEANRKKKALETEKGNITEGDDFKQNTTGASIQIKAESINVATADGDGNLHTNLEAGIRIRTPRMGVSMMDDEGKLVEGSNFSVRTENINLMAISSENEGQNQNATGSVSITSKNVNIEAIDYEAKDGLFTEKELTADSKVSITAKTIEVATTNPKNIEHDDDGNVTKGEYTAEGDVIFRSKNFTVESLDYEVADGQPKMKALTKDGKIAIRAEKTDVLAADAEGKATGSINLNAKAISAKSMDVDKESLADSALAAGSTMTLVSEKMFVGSKSKDVKSKKLQAVSEEMGLFADKTFEAQQGDGKAVVQLDGGNASVGGSKTEIFGATTINDKTEVKGELKAPKGTFDGLEAKSAFKSPSIDDGAAAGGGGGGGSLSAKLSIEEVKSDE
jgi:hypothetical protein